MPRGVYRLPFADPDGHELLVAVSSRGRMVEMRAVGPGEDAREVARELRRRLDAADPP